MDTLSTASGDAVTRDRRFNWINKSCLAHRQHEGETRNQPEPAAMPRYLSLCLFLCSALTAFTQPEDLRALLSQPRQMDRVQAHFDLPVTLVAGKIEVTATVGGQPRRFIFDTGSPTVLTRALAGELGLKVIGQNHGRDASGQTVTTAVAIVPSLEVGGLRFHDFPVFIYDPADESAATGACLLDGGVLGSDLLPGSIWQLDLEAKVLRVASALDQLPLPPAATRAPLHLFGFPHAPIVPWSVPGTLTDKAMFDTGSPATLTVFDRAYEPLQKKRRARTVGILHGYEGEAAGGRGEQRDRTVFTLPQVQIGGQTLADIRAVTRPIAPTLIGAGLLATHVVTLDYVDQQFLIHPRGQIDARVDADFACRWTENGAMIINVLRDSPAWQRGLRPDTLVVAANGRSLLPADQTDPCALAVWLIETLPHLDPLELTIRDDKGEREVRLD